MAEVKIRLLAGDDEKTSREMLRDFSSEVARLDGVDLRLNKLASIDSGNRGDPITLGAVLLAGVSSGGALTELVKTIGSYLTRDRRAEVEISTASGEKVRVSYPTFNLTEVEGSISRLLAVTKERSLRKIAILVANDTFDCAGFPRLHFTKNDVEELKEILEDEACGFQTYVYSNESSFNIRANLNRICRNLTKDDTLLFYFAGHGKVDGNELCLITNDTISESLDATSVRVEHDVLRYFRQSYSERKVMILDCCHSGVAADFLRGNDLDSKVTTLSKRYGTYILAASSDTEGAREKDGHGVFTKALLDCFREARNESITVEDLYSFAFRAACQKFATNSSFNDSL